MKILQFVYRYNKRRHIYIFAISTIVITTLIYSQLFGILYVPNTSIIDFKLVYNLHTFQTSIQSLTIEQVQAYQWIHVIDYVFMIVFYPLQILLLSTLIPIQSKDSYILLIPIFGYVFDMMENIIIDIHLSHFPTMYNLLGHLLTVVTPLKFAMSILAITSIIIIKLKMKQ